MPIPDYQTIMLPLLKFFSDGNVHTHRESIEGWCPYKTCIAFTQGCGPAT